VTTGASASPSGHGWNSAIQGGTCTVAFTGDWVARTDGVDPQSADRILASGARALRFDAGRLGHWDSALIAFLFDLRAAANDKGVGFDEAGLPAPARHLLGLMAAAPSTKSSPPTTAPAPPLLERLGSWTLDRGAEFAQGSALIGNLVLRGGLSLRGQAAMRGDDLVEAMFDAGVAALPIVAVVNVLVGGILAFIGATELRTLGAGIYVANLVAIGMVREMAALMTAIIMAGRTGGAYAATIAAMQGGEEIDAVRVFGIPVFDYLVLPKIVALTIMMPVLYLFGCAVGVVGGLVVGSATLGISPLSFFIQAQGALTDTQLFFGLAKSFAFGALIAIFGCQFGLRAGRGAADVGKAATSAVVAAIVGVIALDALFDVCADILRI
jgi:phospholipid/cholesterol/gamma-HCH transport system permease protein